MIFTRLGKPWTCLIIAIASYATGMSLCITTYNPWFGLVFLVTLRFIIEIFRP